MDSKNTYHHENLRQELIEKGIEIVAKEGAEACTLRRVAAVCNVSHNAPYSHFKNKDALFEAMQNFITRQFTDELTAHIENIGNENTLEELAKVYLHFFIQHKAYYVFLFGKAQLALDLTENAVSETNYQPYEIFKNITKQTLNALNYPKQKVNDAVIALWAFIHGITSLAVMENVTFNWNWEEKLPDFLSIFKL